MTTERRIVSPPSLKLGQSDLEYFSRQLPSEFIEAWKYRILINCDLTNTTQHNEELVEKDYSSGEILAGFIFDQDLLLLQRSEGPKGIELIIRKRPNKDLVPGKITEDIKEGERNPYYWYELGRVICVKNDDGGILEYTYMEEYNGQLCRFTETNSKKALVGLESLLEQISGIPRVFRPVVRGFPNLV
ncbi:hypothetical protein HY389_00070 [Candidatus Daviesbacteria bacterium]|nr:hypothetical protein [Candidatus Daviesbacteria bacterium]